MKKSLSLTMDLAGQTYIKNGTIVALGVVGRTVYFCAHMVYKVIGLMSGSSLDGLDIAYVHLQENAGKWEFSFVHTACHPYTAGWKQRLSGATGLSAVDYQLLHTDYGHYLGEQVNRFIAEHQLQYKVQLIASHG